VDRLIEHCLLWSGTAGSDELAGVKCRLLVDRCRRRPDVLIRAVHNARHAGEFDLPPKIPHAYLLRSSLSGVTILARRLCAAR
jgi:hypothetical protein